MHVGAYTKLQVDNKAARKRDSGEEAKLLPIIEEIEEVKHVEDPNLDNLLPEDDPTNYLEELTNPKLPSRSNPTAAASP